MILVAQPKTTNESNDSNLNWANWNNSNDNEDEKDSRMMNMLNLKRSNHSSPPHGLKSKSSWDHHYYQQQEDELLPHMIESPSGSTETMSSAEVHHTRSGAVAVTPSKDSSSPPFFSSSSRMQERFSATLSKARNQRRRSRRQIQDDLDLQEAEPSNSSILLGANIIKRQLSGSDSPLRATQQEAARHNSSSKETAHWDPWKTHNKTVRGNMLDYSKSDDRFVLTKPKSNRQRKQEILSGGDDYFRVERKNSSRHSSKECTPANTAHLAATAANTTVKNTMECMVQRVSELDDSTFASSTSGNGGYLPNKLMNGLAATCGGGLGSTNSITNHNCSNPQQFLPSALLQPKNANLLRNTSACKSLSDHEELETSTLDFLANLHSREEDLNMVFSNLEQQEQQQQQAKERKTSSNQNKNLEVTSSSYVTAASTPFESMLSAKSTLFERLLKDPAYQHALKAGTLWQSLCSQHVRFPAHWWDNRQPIGPPLGSCKKRPWSYLGRHRVKGDPKLHRLIGNRSSSGRILLHLIVRDEISGAPMEDICCGCYHPNARGIRSTQNFDPKLEDCRDVWIAHRRRIHNDDEDDNDDSNDDSWMTTLESLLIHQNKGRIHQSPLGAAGGKHSVSNQNLRTVFGSKPPVYTVFCLESDLYELFQTKLDGSCPASVVLLRHYLRFQMK